jgi:hypothetical protein
MRTLALSALVLVLASVACGQTAVLNGRVFDESGALIAGAQVVLTGDDGVHRSLSSSEGAYSILGVAAGNYSITASAPSLSLPAMQIVLKAGIQSIDLRLKVVATTTQVSVDETAESVSTEANSNATAMVLKGEDLDALSDDPDDLQSDLEALAGPAAGPGGNAFFVDGFSGGELPAKESIREVRINQNPFSPEYDKMGLGRIEIFTKPGTDKFHGTVGYNVGTDKWNSRNPYGQQKAPFLLRESENSFSGPLSHRASFQLALERNAVDNGSVTSVVILDPVHLLPTPYTSVLTTPQRHTRVGPKLDYQLNERNYLSIHYTWTRADIQDAGIGSFDLISRGYHALNTFHTLHGIETSVHNGWLNEVRFGYSRTGMSTTANTDAPEIQVLGAFNGGGANSLSSNDVQTQYEFRNDTSILRGAHSWRFGVRARRQADSSFLPQNFNGTFTFAGGLAPALDSSGQAIPGVEVQIDSLEQYRRTLIGAPGGAATQFTIATGMPALSVVQYDVSPYVGDEWRFRPNITFDFGLRYETQTNIQRHGDFAPRVGMAWAPGARGNKTAKTVIRLGAGLFYDRFALANTLAAERYNGISQQQYVIQSPAFFAVIPPISVIAASPAALASTREVDSNLRAPYLFQSAVTIERQLPGKNNVSLTWTNTHGLHQLRSEDINAPLPGTFTGKGTGVYPYPGQGPIFLMTSSGLYNQNQLIASFNVKVNAAISLTGSYTFSHAMSNTDGLGTFPANPWDYRGEYGTAITDIPQRVSVSGTINLKWAFRLNPLLNWQSGLPYNITSGTDPYGTTLFFARPGIAPGPLRPGLVYTDQGWLDPTPPPGEPILVRNAGRGPSLIFANLRLTKTWGLGPEKEPKGAAHGLFSNSPASRRYNISLAMSSQNLINHTNPGPINGNILSPLFGQANQIALKVNGEGFSEAANNRRLEAQLKFTY